jgi:hypothetical protein
MNCHAFLPWLQNNLGLAQLPLKTHLISAFVIGLSQLSLKEKSIILVYLPTVFLNFVCEKITFAILFIIILPWLWKPL